MARVFTIAPGLENMGALKTGGQGSVYKGRRIGEIITAIKILPTPIYSESGDDKNYISFQSEVSKLKKVNEVTNPNVVKIISSGISDTGNFPFIEMEYIEGPDLEELLQPPHNSIFTINETLKVAEQLANAIAHCHKVDVRHGDIKSNNIKFNTETGNYVLLDFGLAIMSDEQRRSSYRQIGDIEFMAPEQNTGQMLFQTDVYSFGVVIYELLAGTVPFPLKDRGESARNDVRLAHMVLPVPDLLELRRASLPASWSDKKKEQEMNLPRWLLTMISRCLEKKPEQRFANGDELYRYLIQNLVFKPGNTSQATDLIRLEQAKKDVLNKQEELKKQLDEHRKQLIQKEDELLTLKKLVQVDDSRVKNVIAQGAGTTSTLSGARKVSVVSFVALLFVTLALGAFVMFPEVRNRLFANTQVENSVKQADGDSNPAEVVNPSLNSQSDNVEDETPKQEAPPLENPVTEYPAQPNVDSKNDQPTNNEKEPEKPLQKHDETPVENKPTQQQDENNQDKTQETDAAKPITDNGNSNDNAVKKTEKSTDEVKDENGPPANGVSKKYLVVSKAYFYNDPDENTRRNESISPFENAVVQALNERYGFIYVVITNPQGQVFKGWLRKRDLKLYSID